MAIDVNELRGEILLLNGIKTVKRHGIVFTYWLISYPDRQNPTQNPASSAKTSSKTKETTPPFPCLLPNIIFDHFSNDVITTPPPHLTTSH